jgi:midasin
LQANEAEEGTNKPDTTQADSMAPLGASSGPPPLPNPLRSLGDTLKEIRRRWEQIADASGLDPSPLPKFDESALPHEVEHTHDSMGEEQSLQALGPANESQVAKLSDLHINDDEPPLDSVNPPDDLDQSMETPKVQDIESIPPLMHMDSIDKSTNRDAVVEGALTHDQIKADSPDHSHPNVPASVGAVPATDDNQAPPVPDEKSVELAVKKWQESGHSDAGAGEIWRLYDSLTHTLSFALCEQLRLILEPTLATRLRGDYRTGKRLNMKKIIPYIASEYTKDKIWLRRTRPSQREYQVLLALDDSRSMAESRSVHLAYETLALVSKALGRLESGEVAVARFGEDVEVVHAFEDGMVGEREGEKMMRRFRFEQRRTDVLQLVQASLQILAQARERKAMGRASREAADLWQLEIIISDGVCQDHDRLRTVLRKAEEQRVMIVFVIIDSLHAHHEASAEAAGAAQNSILSMNQVSYKDVGGGQMELQLDRYLDSFPFQYYVVLRSVEALPDVLSGTLRQFFERISEE